MGRCRFARTTEDRKRYCMRHIKSHYKKRKAIIKKICNNRLDALRELGFSSYQQYLSSRLWRFVKIKVFSHRGKSCIRCGKPAQTAHHSSYSLNALVGRDLSRLHPICFLCHTEAEFCGNTKRTLREANEFLGLN